jgi:hypothetical protein
MDIGLLEKRVDLAPGVWIDDIQDQPGLRLKVRSTNFKPYRVAIASISRRFGKRLKTDEGLVEFQAAIGKPLAEHILLDWQGVKNGDADLPYSREIALAVLTADDDHGVGADFRKAVEQAGDEVAKKLAQATEELAGN